MAAVTAPSLHAVLLSMRQQVIERFLEVVGDRGLTPTPSLPREGVLDHIPQFVDEVLDRLDKGSRTDPGSADQIQSAREHASLRWKAHYPLVMMVREYGALRDSIVDVTDEAGARITLREFNILANWITIGVAEAVSEYERRQGEVLRVEKTKVEVERERAEQERRRLATILEILPVGLVISDAEGRIVSTNPADERLWGFTERSDHRERPVWSADGGDRLPTEQRAINRSLRSGEVVLNEEVDIVAADGTPRTLMISSAPLHGAPDSIVGAVAVNVDITEKRAAVATAQEAVAVRDEIIAVVSHDLRDPLGIVEGNAAFIDRLLSRGAIDIPAVRQRLEAIRRSSRRMERLVSDLLDVARIEGGRLPLDIEEWRVAELLGVAAEELTQIATAKSIQLRADLSIDGARTIHCDRNRLLQAFANLVGNAVQFTAREGSVAIGVEDLKSEFRFYVRDNGVGIHPGQMPHIFNRFWTSREPGERRKGTGLGLAIAKGVVELHGGRIWVESALGQGTTVYFTLPAARE